MSALLVIALLLGQAAAPAGQGVLSIRGTVTDQTGGLMAGVTIEIRNDPTRAPQKVLTNGIGVYVLDGLSPGVYEISSDAPDFDRSFRGVDLKATATVDFVLRVHSIESCACVGATLPPAVPLPLPQDPLRRAPSEQTTLRLWQYSVLSEEAKDPQEIDPQQQALIREFRLLGVDGIPTLTQLLKNANPRVRENAVLVLGALGPDARPALPLLWELLTVRHTWTAFEHSVNRAIESINGATGGAKGR